MINSKGTRDFLYKERCILRKTNKQLKKLNRYSKFLTKISKVKYSAEIVSEGNKKWADLMEQYLHNEIESIAN